ncbi:MAG: hypothetical protein K0R03_702 [Moraxellaceae bacterium]|jgi:hypothetical protein|nr:hypothetical protein [Moraxellaceae bacterium]
MKRLIGMAALAALTTASSAGGRFTTASAEIPHGAVDVRNFSRPELVSPHPIIVRFLSAQMLARALYLHVPQSHRTKWEGWCHHYQACGHPVYFVTEQWFERVYRPVLEEEKRRESINRKRNPFGRRGVEF